MSSVNSRHIILITTKQPSSNPRLVKEVIALFNAGYKVSVIYNFWSKWADDADELILKRNTGINWIKVKGHPVHSKAAYWYSRIRYKFYRIMAGRFTRKLPVQVLATTQFYPELKEKALSIPAALYIAHNPGALPAAAAAAKNNNARYAFDAEDFHRGQEAGGIKEAESIALIENRYFPGAAFITAASPLIAFEYEKNYEGFKFPVINNVFSRQQQPLFNFIEKVPLKLFWFSQTVGLKRGLQDVIAALNIITAFPIVLTIVGDANEQVKKILETSFFNSKHRLVFFQPCNETELIMQAAQHHIGLALEPGFSINNNIALSNKLFTYILAGNAVIMTSTAAQQLFYRQYPQVGWCYAPGDIDQLVQIIEQAYNDSGLLNKKRQEAWKLADTTLNWENEQQLFLELVKKAV